MNRPSHIRTRSAFVAASTKRDASVYTTFRLASGLCFEAKIKVLTGSEAGTVSATRSLLGFVDAVDRLGFDAALSIPVSSGKLTIKPIDEVRF